MYSPYEYFLAGKRIVLMPGQLMTTTRRFADDFNTTVSNEEDKTTKSSVHRFFECLARDQFAGHLAVQHAGHQETLITITHSMFYGITFTDSGTGSGTGSGTTAGQVRDNIKRTKEQKNKKTMIDIDLIDTRAREKENDDSRRIVARLRSNSLNDPKTQSITLNELIRILTASGFSSEEITLGISTFEKQNPVLSARAKIENYITKIIQNNQETKKREDNAKFTNKRNSCNKTTVQRPGNLFEKSTSRGPSPRG